MLSLDKLHVQFGGFVVLDDVSMSFSNSKFYLVMARNGSGKSTLLNAISGLTPYSGKIDHDYQPNEIFYSPNDFIFDSNMSGYDYLSLYKQLWSSNVDINDAIKLLKLDSFIHKKINSYSLGMKQMFVLALYVVSDTTVWLMDELNNGLDEANSEILKSVLQSGKNAGKMIIFVTHQPQDLFDLADITVSLNDGRLISND
ncbi:ABC transporter ATP-binding protein (plasmid) [Weissella confusa]|jgi:ABC-2 type transport system ATP-binding protein|uniref:ATP-binding cassette domain-containing protein n=1 Tax=Bacillota TaxID=1239 RepID=UPI0021C0B8FC|nr:MULTISPECIES: ABC transporter ATP-binding protein [Bacillota]MCT8397867.1 ABC transporter ATP-binding protein [Weissella confusa]WEY49394.1 ABC transporter ATP-binding protein [Weissella confusa]